MDATEWDARYGASDLVWGAGPNTWVEQELAGLPPATALDLACGEGRNALWLARQGWQATGVDFSAVAIDKARELESAQSGATSVEWMVADATTFTRPDSYNLVVIAYFQAPTPQRRMATANAVAALRVGGVLLVVGHDLRNLAEGTGGPQSADVLFTPNDVVIDAESAGVPFEVEFAQTRERSVAGAQRPALDAVVRLRRTAG